MFRGRSGQVLQFRVWMLTGVRGKGLEEEDDLSIVRDQSPDPPDAP
jgi:hypothetical protein